MAGSPRKRARKLGLPLPNAGKSPPRHPRARARARSGPLPSDAQLAATAKRTLLAVMQEGFWDRDRVAAARAILEATKSQPTERDALDHLSTPELDALAAKATAALGETVQ
jgi:hypothetical protein